MDDWQIQIIFTQRNQYHAQILCMWNTFSMHITCRIITMHAICELPTTNIFVWSSNLKICFHTDCFHCSYTRKVFILWLGLKRKHYPVYIISQIKCTKNIFVWQSGLKTWLHVDCCHSNYQMLKWKVFFISWFGLKMFYSYCQSQVNSK